MPVNKLPLQESNQLELRCRVQVFPEIFGSNSQFPGEQMPVLPPWGRPCDHWLFYVRFHKHGQLI